MRVNLEIQPGQETRGDKLTISEVLAEYLRAEKSHLAPKTHVRYTEVIALFTHSLNSYAANSLSQFERARFDKLFNAEGEQHREFCDIFGPEHILENVGEFLNLSFPKIRSGRIRAVRENQTIIQCHVCNHLPAWNIYRRSAQVAVPA